MDECVFCRIVKGELSCHRVAENERFLAFLDIMPISEGHTLVIPKQHATNFLDMPEYLGNGLVEFAQHVAQAIVAAVGADGFNIGLNNGKAAGQAVFHAHFHIIPRKEGDGLKTWPQREATEDELAAALEKVLAAMERT